jgi:hypothetical protein
MPDARFQIPWAKDTRVKDVHGLPGDITSIELEKEGAVLTVDRWGTVEIERDSSKDIADFMTKSEPLTKSLRKYLKSTGKYFIDGTIDWLRGGSDDDNVPKTAVRGGILDWWPDAKLRQRVGKKGQFQSGRPSDITEYWIGSHFPFVHLVLMDGEEGLAVDFKKPEVWLGDVDSFFVTYSEDWTDPETYRSYNAVYENGMLWALDEMGVFDGKAIHRYPHDPDPKTLEIPGWAADVIEDDPDLMWPELVEKLARRLEDIPYKVEKAVELWIDKRNSEAEQATGTQYFWPKGE